MGMLLAVLLLIIVMVIYFRVIRAIYLIFQPQNHPGNIALRKALWRHDHPDAPRTPWDPPRSSAE